MLPNFKFHHISYYLTKKNLISFGVSVAIIIFSLLTYLLFQRIFKDKYQKNHYHDCLRSHMHESQRLKETLCQGRGYEKDCEIENLADEDIEVFIRYFETGKAKCQQLYP